MTRQGTVGGANLADQGVAEGATSEQLANALRGPVETRRAGLRHRTGQLENALLKGVLAHELAIGVRRDVKPVGDCEPGVRQERQRTALSAHALEGVVAGVEGGGETCHRIQGSFR